MKIFELRSIQDVNDYITNGDNTFPRIVIDHTCKLIIVDGYDDDYEDATPEEWELAIMHAKLGVYDGSAT